ncbi:MAG TPA: hypothetical protein VN493_27645 [Thermoanaerobaculia bacterium]|nr:hypothetical protein [Thermoanaerobaculia bacterium]
MATIEDRLIEDIERGGLGEFDGNEVGPGETTLFMAWGTKDFYVEDPDGYIIAFGGRCLDQLPIIAQACG